MDDYTRWGLARISLGDHEQLRLLELARKLLNAHSPFEFNDDEVLVGQDVWFLPCGYIGSVGALFIPSRPQVIPLGSYTGLDDFLWAYHRGFDLAKTDEPAETLTVRAVRDREVALKHLRAAFRPTRVGDLCSELTNLPAVFTGLDLYFSIPDLRALEDSGACDFDVGGAGGRPEVIRFYSVTDEYGEFSNFASFPIVVGKQQWQTSEHYFQSQKFADPKDRKAIRSANTAMLAARMGRDRRRKLRRDWESAKVSVMREAVGAKFRQHEELALMLLATGTAKLVEHTDHDSYWGDGGNGRGKNMLGRILMELRSELALERG